ncbi:hypothetical protein [Clostridium sp.]|uniref:hypothetical protein n=1 Tax=Clostridium sp. TaxID=1506 RepID=UPI002FC61374
MYDAKQLAEILNVSKVTVYKKLEKYKDKVVVKGGKKYATEDLVNLLREDLKVNLKENKALNEEVNEVALSLEKSSDVEQLINLNKEIIKSLQEQLTVKDKQLQEKDNQIKELQEIIKQNNKLVENSQVLLKEKSEPLLLEERFHAFDEKLDEMKERMEHRHSQEEKKGFWSKFKTK